MSYNTKNYSEQGGDKLVIGGELEIKEGAVVTGLETGGSELSPASETSLGGIMASERSGTDTVEAKIGSDNKLYVPAYPEVATMPVAENQADSTAADVDGLVADFNALLAKLKAAGLMAAD